MNDLFDLTGRVAVITGGAGLMGMQHAEVIAAHAGIPVLLDVVRAEEKAADLERRHGVRSRAFPCDITQPETVREVLKDIVTAFGRVDILINNAAHNPKMENTAGVNFSRFENFPIDQWQSDLAVGLTGAYLCSQVIGSYLAQSFREHGRRGVILNIASDLALIGPDQRIYQEPNVPDHLQPVKPVTYSVVKSGLVGLTRYLATYWADSGVRVNAISPGGIYNNQPDAFVKKLTNLIPMGRMARLNEYQGTVLYLVSDASSYMTGHNLVVDGGRTAW